MEQEVWGATQSFQEDAGGEATNPLTTREQAERVLEQEVCTVPNSSLLHDCQEWEAKEAPALPEHEQQDDVIEAGDDLEAG